ncbi:MAG: SMC family ATPase, partial [Treponema sp.]|nr:SMC family ATPase [Treponema sp.]
MRPLNIKLSAFGPYANEIEIPLKDLGTSGLYLITGDTGSGKTTIFDAICFALYGKASGENRDESMLRSKYANAECPTFVELKFLHQGKEYFIKRNPEYTRPSKKGSGETKESASVEFYLPNGTVLSKKDDVRDAIKNLLGLDREQFSKITMLAQGTFSRLLFSDGKEKSAIFRNLFNTQNYETLQNVLSEKEKECADSVKAGKQIIREHVASIFVNDDAVLSLDVEKAKKNEITTEEIILLLEKLITQDNKLKEKNAKEFNKIKDELELVNKRIGEIEGQEKAKNEIKEISQELKNEIPKRGEFEKNLNNAKEELKQKDKIDLKATKIESELKKYDSINELTEIIKELKNKNEKSNIDLNAKKIRCEEFRIKLDSLKKELESIKDSPIQLAKLQSELEKLQNEKKDLEELEKSFMLVEQRQKDLLAIQNEYRKKDSLFNELNNLYEKMEQAFRDGQAGILA